MTTRDMQAAVAGPGHEDAAEIAKFEAMSADWWDADGPFRPLHAMNPCRIGYIVDQASAEFGRDPRRPGVFQDLSVADIGCGGGLASEPMARLGARVTGYDAAAESLGVARAHGARMGLDIDYREDLAEAAVARGETYDIVLALEIVEHVTDQAAFVATLGQLVRPGGMLFLSTLNRTPESYAMAIIGAERILGWLPKGTHDWSKFPPPDALERMVVDAGLEVVDTAGMVLDPLRREWRIAPRQMRVNYILAAVKPGG